MFSFLMQWAREEIAEWRRIANIRQLNKLSDSQLDDIGLSRDRLFLLEAERPDRPHSAAVRAVFQPGYEPCG